MSAQEQQQVTVWYRLEQEMSLVSQQELFWCRSVLQQAQSLDWSWNAHGYPQAREYALNSASSQEKVTVEESAVPKVHVSVVRKEPRFHEEA